MTRAQQGAWSCYGGRVASSESSFVEAWPRTRWRRQAWTNGGGVTWELVREPAGGEFALRISRAELPETSTFSVLPGVERALVLAQGRVTLQIDGATDMLVPGALVRFRGDATVTSTGAGEDINIMWRQPLRPDIRVVSRGDTIRSGANRLLLVEVTELALAEGSSRHSVPIDGAAWINGTAHITSGIGVAITWPHHPL